MGLRSPRLAANRKLRDWAWPRCWNGRGVNRRLLVLLALPLAGVYAGYVIKHKPSVTQKPASGWVMSNFALQTANHKKELTGISFTLLPKGAPGATLRLQGHNYPCVRAKNEQDFHCKVTPPAPLAHDGLKTLHIAVNKTTRRSG